MISISLGFTLGALHALDFQRKGDVLHDGAVGKEREMLKDHAHLVPPDLDHLGGRGGQAGSGPERRSRHRLARSSRERQRTKVDLPEPERPMITRISPRFTSRLASRTAAMCSLSVTASAGGLPPWRFRRPSGSAPNSFQTWRQEIMSSDKSGLPVGSFCNRFFLRAGLQENANRRPAQVKTPASSMDCVRQLAGCIRSSPRRFRRNHGISPPLFTIR